MDLRESRDLMAMVAAMGRDDLSVLASMVREEQHRRALAAGDLEAVVAEAFDQGFDARGMATDPWITPGGLLVCPGSKIHRSKQSHRCRFVAVGQRWVWDAAERLTDEVRHLPDRHESVQTVTVLAAVDGLRIDVVTSRASGGAHTRESSSSWEVRAGALEPASSQGVTPSDHRR